ncbi:MAG: carboxypeptidase-like regulatory domain-containing protein, partial [Ktedonobacterales bacterium]
PTPTATANATPTATGTVTATATPTASATATATATPVPGGSITGTVTDSSGTPLANAQVATMPASATTTTDANGNYTLANVPAGTYDVIAAAGGYNATYVTGVTVTINNTTSAQALALAAEPPYTAMDTYYRPNQPGWNPASDSNTWTDDTSVYPGSSDSIVNNQGYVDTYTAGTDRDEWLGNSYSDQLVSGDFNVLQYGQDAYQHGARLLGRVRGTSTFIDFAINYATSTLQIWYQSNGNWGMMAQVNVPAFQTGTWYHAKLLLVGNQAYGKVWAYGTSEPNWQITGTQSFLTSGMGGLRSTFCDIYWANFSSQAVTTVTGVVTDTNGHAIAGATVSDGTTTATTDANGRYVLIESNTSNSYTITASATGYSSQNTTVSTTSLTSTTANFTLS